MDWISFSAIAGLTLFFVLLAVLGLYARSAQRRDDERRKAALNPFKK